MMRDVGKGEVVAIAEECSVREHVDGEEIAYIDKPRVDIEAMFYKDTNSLCFQPHPEFYGAHSTREYYFELLERYLGLK
ncbi:hypothetical protein D3C85_1693660 [compost metagenome]